MLNNKREKLHRDVFMMYDAKSESIGNHTHDAVVKIDELRRALTGGDVYSKSEFNTEINYLIERKYFRRYANNHVIATADGIDKILGETSYSRTGISSKKKNWYDYWWVKYLILPMVAIILGTFIIYLILWAYNLIK